MLEELKMSTEMPIKLFCDNKAAISISHNPVHQDRTKHIEVDRFIKEKIYEETICMVYLQTAEQTTNILTKGLFQLVFENFVHKLGINNLYNTAWGGALKILLGNVD